VKSGMSFGMGLNLAMNLILLPLSGLHATEPLQIRDLMQGPLVHLILIAYSLRRFAN